MRHVFSWLVGLIALLLRATCRLQFHDDPRPRLRRNGQNHLVAILHAHQAAAAVVAEPETAVVVSRSEDGEIIIPTVRLTGCVAVRGSGGKIRKGGSRAIKQMIEHVRSGRPAAFTVDGPLGPRGCVHRGVALLSQKTGTPVVPLLLIPSRRVIIRGTWDRLQIPLPFSKVHVFGNDVLHPDPQESLTAFARRIEDALSQLDRRYDPQEAAFSLHARRRAEGGNTAANPASVGRPAA